MRFVNAKDFEGMSFLFRGKTGNRFAQFLMRILSIEKVNQLCDRSSQYTGAAFAAGILKDLGVEYVIGNPERLQQLPEGAFITVSNHPYGGLDGVITIDLMAGIRSDYKFMVNKMLSLIKSLDENFISVTPAGNKNKGISGTSINGIRETLSHLRNGHPVGFFPSGAVSDFSLKDRCVRDRPWQVSILRLIHSAKVPILPIRFFDGNSPFYYFLGLIDWRVRLARVPSELFNKRNQVHRIGIGTILSVQEQEQYPDAESLGAFLRKMVYEMPLPSSFIPRNILNFPEK